MTIYGSGANFADLNKEELSIWITALRSGKYTQGIHFLQTESGYCCLGVACKVLIPNENLDLMFNGKINGGEPLDQPSAPRWLKCINEDMRIRTGKSLINLNDDDKLTFNEIADILEKTYLTEEK
jgi:hypothetical protein